MNISGPPYRHSTASDKSRQATEFWSWLGRVPSLPVDLIDERYTTAMARKMLAQTGLSGKKRKAVLDKLAAQIILASFLDQRGRN